MSVTRRAAMLGAAAVGATAAGGGLWLGYLAARKRADDAAVAKRYPPLGRLVRVEGGVIHVLDQPGPRPAAPTVVLIHGASGNLRDFGYGFTERLTARYRVVAVDRPGFGHSSRGDPAIAHRPDVQARMLRAAIDAIGVTRAVLVGHSFGAAPALAWALDAPETVRGVVSLAGVSHPFPGSVGGLYELTAAPILGAWASLAARKLYPEERVQRAVARFFAPDAPPPGYLETVGVGLALRPDTFRANAMDLTRVKAFLAQQQPRYATLAAPVEIVHGDADKIVWASIHGAALAREAPAARLTLALGVGHMPHHAAPDLCVAAIDRIAAAAQAG